MNGWNEDAVREYFSGEPNADEKVEEYLNLATHAANIGTPEDLMNPVTVYQEGRQFRVISGHRRVLAHYILDAQKIAAVIRKAPESLKRYVFRWVENEDRDVQSKLLRSAIIQAIINPDR